MLKNYYDKVIGVGVAMQLFTVNYVYQSNLLISFAFTWSFYFM